MMKYKVLIVDDEPAAVHFIEKIIELKCPGLEVAATADSGLEALSILNVQPIDVVFTDIMMPEMNGVELVSYICRDFPYICSVVVSGHQDFDFVKETLRTGAADYILKPINLNEMAGLCRTICLKLDTVYHNRRNLFFRRMSKDSCSIDQKELTRLFPSSCYYAAIIRRNGLIPRFNNNFNHEIFSTENSQIIVYGRDDLEMLFLYPEEMIFDDFGRIMNREFEKLKSKESFLTMVISEQRFSSAKLPEMIRRLYQTLDHSVVTGMEQKIRLDETNSPFHDSPQSTEHYQYLLYLLEKKETEHLPSALKTMFGLWEKEHRTQFDVESKVRYLFYHAKSMRIIREWNEYSLEDAFATALTMDELCMNILEILSQNASEISTAQYDKETIFQEVISYMKSHLNGDLSVQNVCKKIGISPATLNRLFRTYTSMPYKNYLTGLRIEHAQIIMQNNPESYIKDIAAYVGFKDQFYFSRVFRSITGISPTEYLENLSPKEEQTKKSCNIPSIEL